ncbi:MAG: hypothetical protein CSA75_03345 [Sorangium cellulosum]|nr:MAG: hypothetical protein CSA75_03345 [Sorangium cellulosum]
MVEIRLLGEFLVGFLPAKAYRNPPAHALPLGKTSNYFATKRWRQRTETRRPKNIRLSASQFAGNAMRVSDVSRSDVMFFQKRTHQLNVASGLPFTVTGRSHHPTIDGIAKPVSLRFLSCVRKTSFGHQRCKHCTMEDTHR